MTEVNGNATCNVCPNCGAPVVVKNDKFNKNVRYFCGECGYFLRKNELVNPKIADAQEMKLARIIENLKYVPHSKILWDDMSDRYATRVEKFKALYELDDIKPAHRVDVSDKMNVFLEKCRKAEFTIAFVGTIKTGKSTLINALLGKNYASMDVTPETAALTKFRSSKQDYVRVSFYDDKEYQKLWKSVSMSADAFKAEYKELHADEQKDKWINHSPIYKEMNNADIENELKIWSSSKRAEHYFVKEIEVGISTLGEDFPEQVVFVDTPGLSDPVAYRSDITRKYIEQASAVFVCVEAKKMHQEEIETISSVFSFAGKDKDKVHIIATHWDSLNHPIEDWEKEREWMLKMLVAPAYFDTREQADENILHSSAYIYNLCRDFPNLTDKEKRPLLRFAFCFEGEEFEKEYGIDIDDIESCLPFFKEISNIDSIKRVINEHLLSRYKEMLQHEIEQRFEDIMHTLKSTVREERKQYQENIEATQGTIEDLQKRIDAQRQGSEEIFENGKSLESALEGVEEKTDKILQDILSSISKERTEQRTVKQKPKKKSFGSELKESLKRIATGR